MTQLGTNLVPISMGSSTRRPGPGRVRSRLKATRQRRDQCALRRDRRRRATIASASKQHRPMRARLAPLAPLHQGSRRRAVLRRSEPRTRRCAGSHRPGGSRPPMVAVDLPEQVLPLLRSDLGGRTLKIHPTSATATSTAGSWATKCSSGSRAASSCPRTTSPSTASQRTLPDFGSSQPSALAM